MPRRGIRGKSPVWGGDDEDDNNLQGTETPGGKEDGDVMDEVGSQDAFIANWIWLGTLDECLRCVSYVWAWVEDLASDWTGRTQGKSA